MTQQQLILFRVLVWFVQAHACFIQDVLQTNKGMLDMYTDPVNTNFAQWQYSNQWSYREVLLLLVENYNQYPALVPWNIGTWGNFWKFLREQVILV